MIPLFKVFCSENICSQLKPVFDSGYIGQGKKVEEFEKELKKRLKSEYVVATNSGTSAIHMALHMVKSSSSDEVLTTPLTCTATNWPILANGMKLKWVDIDPKTLNLDLDDVARKIGPNCSAVMVVHWGGYPVDLDRLREIVDGAKKKYKRDIAIIEDCAHSFGSEYKGMPIGSHGNYCAFSFQAIKHLTCGDGGVLIAPSSSSYDKAILNRWYGIDRNKNTKDFRCEGNISDWGFKFHMNDINATIGLTNLQEVDEAVIKKQKRNAQFYDKHLQGVDGVTLLSNNFGFDSAYWIYTILVERRPDFYKAMKDAGIMVSQVHERNDKHSCVSQFKSALPNLDATLPSVVSIPVGWWVTEKQRTYIVKQIERGW